MAALPAALGLLAALGLPAVAMLTSRKSSYSYPAHAPEAPAAPAAGRAAGPQPHPPAKGAGLGGALLPACAPRLHRGRL